MRGWWRKEEDRLTGEEIADESSVVVAGREKQQRSSQKRLRIEYWNKNGLGSGSTPGVIERRKAVYQLNVKHSKHVTYITFYLPLGTQCPITGALPPRGL